MEAEQPTVSDNIPKLYSPLPEGSFRLVTLQQAATFDQIQCRVEVVPHSPAPVFDALSYAWGDANDRVSIQCNGVPTTVTRPLAEFLVALEHYQRETGVVRPFWTDAICINQEEDGEKSREVMRMHEIYSAAETVHIWLGPASEHSGSFLRSVERLNEALNEAFSPGPSGVFSSEKTLTEMRIPPPKDPAWLGMGDVLGSSWFERLWIVQEAVLARQAIFHCGPDSSSWEQLVILARKFMGFEVGTHVQLHLAGVTVLSQGFGGCESLAELDNCKRHVPTGTNPLLGLLHMGRTRLCSEPVDRVYAMLGLTSQRMDSSLTVDYSIEARKEYWRLYLTMGHILLEQQPDLLSLHYASTVTSFPGLPSWCLNLNSEPDCVGLVRKRFQAGGRVDMGDCAHIGSSVDRQRILLQGLLVTQVAAIAHCRHELFAEDNQDTRKVRAEQRSKWFLECIELSRSGSLQTNQALPTSYAECLRTLVGDDLHHEPSEVETPAKELFAIFAAATTTLKAKTEPGGPRAPPRAFDERAHLVLRYTAALDRANKGRRVFKTKTGRLGSAHHSVQPGDLVCVFRKSTLPYILRRAEEDDGTFVLVGSAYVSGAMYGEAWQGRGEEFVGDQQFWLK